MGRVAFVFSGQGAQYQGMGKSLYDNFESAKAVYDRAEKLSTGIKNICFNSDIDKLSITVNAQPSLFLSGLAGAYALKESGIDADICGGFSLGEIPALVFSGMLGFDDGFKLVCERAKAMQRETEKFNGSMAAVIGVHREDLKELLKGFDNLYMVNFNSENQIVISGESSRLNEFTAFLKERKIRAVKLAVSGAFHSPYMSGAANTVAEYLKGVKINEPSVEIYSNLSGEVYSGDYKNLIARQIDSAVQWHSQVLNMRKKADIFIEVGAGKVLCNLIKKIIPSDVIVSNADSLESLNQALTLCLKENRKC